MTKNPGALVGRAVRISQGFHVSLGFAPLLFLRNSHQTIALIQPVYYCYLAIIWLMALKSAFTEEVMISTSIPQPQWICPSAAVTPI